MMFKCIPVILIASLIYLSLDAGSLQDNRCGVIFEIAQHEKLNFCNPNVKPVTQLEDHFKRTSIRTSYERVITEPPCNICGTEYSLEEAERHSNEVGMCACMVSLSSIVAQPSCLCLKCVIFGTAFACLPMARILRISRLDVTEK